MAVFTTIPLADAIKTPSTKTYCKCGAYAKVTNDQCKYCRPTCEGSGRFPQSGRVKGRYSECDFCGHRVRIDNEFGKMKAHTVR